MPEELELLRLPDRPAWRAWLERNHATSTGVRLAIRKKGASEPAVGYEDAVEEALAFGWIDSTAGAVDEDVFAVRMTPRKRGSAWARTNKERVERLLAEGRMAAAGLAAVEAAKADGSWSAYDDVENMTVPGDLAEALAADPVAQANFEAFPPSVRKVALYRLMNAKRPETREKRIAEIVADAAANVRRTSP
jgi:uncharacterized protein YdeI (YjbR/CyaY-like superfamily)